MCHCSYVNSVSAVIATAIVLLVADVSRAQLPGLPGVPPTAAAKGNPASAPPQEKTKSAVAAPSGPITVKKQVSDHAIHTFLEKFLPRYPGVRTADVAVR